MKLDPEDFQIWKEHPVTRRFFRALEEMALDRQSQWMRESWGTGFCDQRRLDQLRGQNEILETLISADHTILEDQDDRTDDV